MSENPKIIIVLENGFVTQVLSDESVDYCVVDRDDIQCGEDSPLCIEEKSSVTTQSKMHEFLETEYLSNPFEGYDDDDDDEEFFKSVNAEERSDKNEIGYYD